VRASSILINMPDRVFPACRLPLYGQFCNGGPCNTLMKKIIFSFLWAIVSFVLGSAIFFSLISSVLWIPAHADVSQPDVQRKALDIGLSVWIFFIIIPLSMLILGFCGILPGTRQQKGSMQA